MPKPAAPPDQSGLLGFGAIAGVLVLIAIAGKCSGSSSDTNYNGLMNAANDDLGNAIAAQTPSATAPLNPISINKGVAHLRLVVAAEGFSGAMIYSQNCYDALSREFSWSKLDQCGGADMLAARSIEDVDTGDLSSEAAWFQSEAGAGRYLAVASGAGLAPNEADERLSQLQAKLANSRTVRPPEPPTVAEVTEDRTGSNQVEEGDELVNLAESDLAGE
jgi:hypothetical protein